jgi:hypothetical protein
MTTTILRFDDNLDIDIGILAEIAAIFEARHQAATRIRAEGGSIVLLADLDDQAEAEAPAVEVPPPPTGAPWKTWPVTLRPQVVRHDPPAGAAEDYGTADSPGSSFPPAPIATSPRATPRTCSICGEVIYGQRAMTAHGKTHPVSVPCPDCGKLVGKAGLGPHRKSHRKTTVEVDDTPVEVAAAPKVEEPATVEAPKPATYSLDDLAAVDVPRAVGISHQAIRDNQARVSFGSGAKLDLRSS